MRVFAAVDPPTAVVAALHDVLPDDDRLRWSDPAQWHVTTAFYGDVAPSGLAELSARLERAAARTAPFTLTLEGLGGFPSTGRATVVYAALGGDLGAVHRLAERCAAAGRRTGVEMERRRFRPHLTLARSRRNALDLRGLDVRYDGPPWQVERLRLVSSRLGATVSHRTVAEWPLSYQA